MRIILFIISLVCLQATAQTPAEYCKQINDIATMERIAHERIASTANATQASNNFEIKYYRCEWEVNPAIYYITGKVTAYFVMTAPSTSISFDLMSSLTVDSVKQRNVLLTRLHASDVLQVNFATTINAGTLDSISIY